MKYQIYLNKETSILFNKLAEKSDKKPATVIKQLLESFARLSQPMEGELLKSYGKHEKQ